MPKPPAAPAAPASAQAGATTVVAVAAPGPPKQTLPEFLGLKGACQAVRGAGQCVISKLGQSFPGLEPGPPVKLLTDPANMDSPISSVKAAAEIKQDKDAADQTVKALRYLATVGCTRCYPDVEKALVEALDDCTEEVRFAAVQALRDTAGKSCETCQTAACCTDEILRRIDKIANESDAQGCPVESSARVRRLARVVISACGRQVAATPQEGPTEEKGATPQEGPTDEPPPAEPGVAPETPEAPPPADATVAPSKPPATSPASIKEESQDSAASAAEDAPPHLGDEQPQAPPKQARMPRWRPDRSSRPTKQSKPSDEK